MGNGYRRNTDSLPTCMNCGSVLYGGFCSNCGQRSCEELTFGGIFRDFRERGRRLDYPWPRTVIDLSRGPGRMVRAYLRGRRLPYVGPLVYAFFTATACAVLACCLHFDLSTPGTPWSGGGERDARATFAFGGFSLFWVAAVVAQLQRLLFSQERYGFAQTWIFGLYIFGHLWILQTLFALLGAYGSPLGLSALAGGWLSGLTFALAGFYRRPMWKVLPAALLLGTTYVGGVFVSASLFRILVG